MAEHRNDAGAMPARRDQILSEGKTKTLFATDDPERLIMRFRDDTTGFDGKKTAQLDRKGRVNNAFNAFIMERLNRAGVPTHFERRLSDAESLVKRLDMFPVECVVRNLAAGSLCRRLGIAEGQAVDPPSYELFYKDDALGDPMINESHAIAFGWAPESALRRCEELTRQVNGTLKPLFLAADMLLVDYKLEFGMHGGEVTLGDEFTPDGCRLWDRQSRTKMDKDRFRQDLGDVVESYEIAGRRLGIEF